MRDTARGYGWISILLHWATAIVVVAMLMTGDFVQGGKVDAVHRHTTIGIAMYVLLWARIVWRFRVGHPGPTAKQGRLSFAVGQYFHYAFLIAIGIMLISGPLMAWSAGDSIHVFWMEIPGPIGEDVAIHRFLRAVHGYTAAAILAALVLHSLAAIKHALINKDGTFDKIVVPDRGRRA